MIKRNLLANYLGGAWSALMSVAFIPLYIQYLGIEAFGLIGVFVALQGWFALLDMGLTPTINREMARFTAGRLQAQQVHDLLRSMEVVFFVVAVLIALSLVAISPWLASNWLSAQTLSDGVISQALSITGVIIGLRWFGSLYRGAMLGLQRQVWLNTSNAFFATLRGGGAVLAILTFGPSIQVFFIFQGIAALLEALVLWMAVRSFLPKPASLPAFRLESLRSIGRFAAGMTWITILSTLMTQVDKLILSRMVSLSEFGYFTLATTVASVLIMLAIPVSNVAFPRFTTLAVQKDQDSLSALYHRFSQIVAMTVMPAAVVVSIYSERILSLWTNDAVTSAAVSPLLSVWIIGTAINALTHMPYSIQLAHGRLQLTSISYSAIVIVMASALILTVPVYGAKAATWIWLAANLGYVLIAVPVMHLKILPSEFGRWFWIDTMAPTAAALVVALALKPVADTFMTTGHVASILVLGLSGSCTLFASVVATPTGRLIISKTITQIARH